MKIKGVNNGGEKHAKRLANDREPLGKNGVLHRSSKNIQLWGKPGDLGAPRRSHAGDRLESPAPKDEISNPKSVDSAPVNL
jgi:hypothetical protein